MPEAIDDGRGAMALPAGKTCGDCAHIRRCGMMFGHVETDTFCDWSPSRYRDRTPAPAAQTKESV